MYLKKISSTDYSPPFLRVNVRDSKATTISVVIEVVTSLLDVSQVKVGVEGYPITQLFRKFARNLK